MNGAEGADAAMIETSADEGPYPAAFLASTLNLYSPPTSSREAV